MMLKNQLVDRCDERLVKKLVHELTIFNIEM